MLPMIRAMPVGEVFWMPVAKMTMSALSAYPSSRVTLSLMDLDMATPNLTLRRY